jgi:hypothetical protein
MLGEAGALSFLQDDKARARPTPYSLVDIPRATQPATLRQPVPTIETAAGVLPGCHEVQQKGGTTTTTPFCDTNSKLSTEEGVSLGSIFEDIQDTFILILLQYSST